jgi:hypothetical protein
MAETTQAKSSESELVVEEGIAQQRQAQFTRFQIALGLKESLKAEGRLRELFLSEFY